MLSKPLHRNAFSSQDTALRAPRSSPLAAPRAARVGSGSGPVAPETGPVASGARTTESSGGARPPWSVLSSATVWVPLAGTQVTT